MCASKPNLLRAGVLCLSLALSGIAAGAEGSSREQEQIRRLRLQLQQLQQQQASDQADAQKAAEALAAAKAGHAQASAELKRLRAQQAALQQEQAASLKALDDLRAQLTALQQGHDDLRSRLEASQQSLVQARAERDTLQRSLDQRSLALQDLSTRHVSQAQGLQTCIQQNQSLYTLGQELLARYARKGVREALAEQEPFMQTQRVALENLLQGYQEKLDTLALKPGAGAGGATEPSRAP